MEHLSKSRLRGTGRYLLENLPIQITLVVALLALLLVIAIPFLKAQSDPPSDPLPDPASDPWDSRVQVTFHGLGSLVRTTTDSNGREVFMIVDRWYNAGFNEEVDGQRTAFTTLVKFRWGSETIYLNGIRQVPQLHYNALTLESGKVIGVEFKTPPQVLADGSKDVLLIDFDPIGYVR